ncbi:hypothetical protein D3C80_1097780 [compost metagenome]
MHAVESSGSDLPKWFVTISSLEFTFLGSEGFPIRPNEFNMLFRSGEIGSFLKIFRHSFRASSSSADIDAGMGVAFEGRMSNMLAAATILSMS